MDVNAFTAIAEGRQSKRDYVEEAVQKDAACLPSFLFLFFASPDSSEPDDPQEPRGGLKRRLYDSSKAPKAPVRRPTLLLYCVQGVAASPHGIEFD